MMACDESRFRIACYVDGELPAAEHIELEAHLVECAACRAEYESLKSAVDTVRGAQSLYDAPHGAAERARAALLKLERRDMWRRRAPFAAAAAILLCTLLGGVHWMRAGAHDRFATFAADSHHRYTRGVLPLDVATANADELSAWLSQRLSFHLSLPNYPTEHKAYTLIGARLLQHDDADMAYVAYRMQDGRPISLMMASSNAVTPAGGAVYRSGGLTFHISRHRGLTLITWQDRGISYALASDFTSPGAESCIICHEQSKRFRLP